MMQLVDNTKLSSHFAPFPSYCRLLVKFWGYLSLTHLFGVNPLNSGLQNLT